MNHQEQVTAVKKAFDLSTRISETESELSKLLSESFRSKPMPPQHETVSVVYPEIKPNTQFWTKDLWPALVFWPYIIIYYFTTYKKNREADIEKIRNSDEFRRQCASIDEEARQRQAVIDEQYNADLKEYNEKIIPEYQRELENWTKEHKLKTDTAQASLKNAQQELAEHYEATKIVPIQYRDIETLQYIYDMISSSEYNVRETIEMYDKERQRRLEEQKIYEQQIANSLANEQNDLLYEQNSISEQARKDARNAAIIGAVQRHNTNKILKDTFKKR